MTSAEDGSTEASIDESATRSTTGSDDPDSMATSDGRAAPTGPPSEAEERALGWRGWVLVGATVVAFVGVPLVILFRPPSLPFLVAYLALPLLPAFLLAALAVWVALPRDKG